MNSQGKYISGTILEEGKQAFNNFFSAVRNAKFEKEDIVFIDIAFDNLKQTS